MTTIRQALKAIKFLGRHYSYTGGDLSSFSDRQLQDIGFRFARHELDAVKPFWLA